jgi:adenine-specific DNA methylase
MNNDRRLIEAAFPLKQASLDSVHEKNVRHGHISTLHIWPARRPLAACRAALIATLLPDPGTPEERKRLVEKIGGTVVTKIERKKIAGKTVEVEREETVGGVLHWGRESNPDMDWFREQIRKTYNGRAPRVLDPFAGGGAIPLEAMRLGCDVTAMDINPVAWFILRCTLEYPQKLAGQKRPLPNFVLKDGEFMEAFFKAQGLKGALLRTQLERVGLERSKEPMLTGFDPGDPLLQADLAWHVRAWGRWVVREARRTLGKYYPTYADFEPVAPCSDTFEKREMRLVPVKDDGTADVEALNAEFSEEYLGDKKRPRWIAKPTVAYLWARTITCKNCRASIPLLKTRWLARRGKKRTLLTLTPLADGRSGVAFAVEKNVAEASGNTARRREHDKRISAGTFTSSGPQCPCCSAITPLEDYQYQGTSSGLGRVLVACVVETAHGKDYRLPTPAEIAISESVSELLKTLGRVLPYGLPCEPISAQRPSPNARGMSGLTRYGINTHDKLYSPRQFACLGQFIATSRSARNRAISFGYDDAWLEAINGFLYCAFARLADRSSTICTWRVSGEFMGSTFTRFALPMTTDFAEVAPFADSSGAYLHAVEWVAAVIDSLSPAPGSRGNALVRLCSAEDVSDDNFDVILTDPPYYDSVPYADVMDFFYVWARRYFGDAFRDEFQTLLAPREKEYIQHAGRFGGDNAAARQFYERKMSDVFASLRKRLAPEGTLVLAFAHKDPLAWEVLVSSIVRSGFVVDGSWPIQTERAARMLALNSSALSSSVWIVCKRRPESARAGWDASILEEMRRNIDKRLREFWDAGIRGPDFVWAATGPALEAYSKHPVVKKANAPGETMTVSEFLRAVRRIVVDFVVGRVLTKGQDGSGVSGLDDVTTYYLLHRNDFGLGDAAAGACILYAVSCGLSDSALTDQCDILARVGGQPLVEDEEEQNEDTGESEDVAEGTGSRLKLRPWHQRKRAGMGYDTEGRPAPLIDQVHRLMHLWKGGDQFRVDDYIEHRNLRKSALFHQILQALIELSAQGSEERALLESLSNHLAARGAMPQAELPLPAEEAQS